MRKLACAFACCCVGRYAHIAMTAATTDGPECVHFSSLSFARVLQLWRHYRAQGYR